MPWTKTPLIGQPYENVEDVELTDMNSTVVDGYVNEMDHIIKRPGLESWKNTGTGLPVDGLYWFDEGECVLVVSNKRVWKITDSSGTMTELTGSTALLAGGIVSFATDGTKVVMANGANMVHTDLSTLTTMADAQAPTAVTHIASMDGYLLAMSSGQVNFSDPLDITSWTALDMFQAEGTPDDNVAMGEAYRELIILGHRSVEFWYNDGTTPFSRLSGGNLPYGCSAPYSLARTGSTWMWLDHERRLVTMNGRQVVPVSNPYERVIQRYENVDDAVGYAMSVDGYPIYVLNFPTARQTLTYNYQTQKWSKWGYWNTTTGGHERFRGQAYCYARKWNMHLVGDWQNGLVYKAKRDVYTDNTNMIRTVVRTGHLNYGTESSKRSNTLRLRMKRGVGNASVTTPQITVRRRNNGMAQWENERWGSLGAVGQADIQLDFRRNGIFKATQLEIVHSDDSEFVLAGAEEDIESLGR